MIKYTCPKCRSMLESPRSLGGQYDKCPLCGSRNVVPSPTRPVWRWWVFGGCGAGLGIAVCIALALWHAKKETPDGQVKALNSPSHHAREGLVQPAPDGQVTALNSTSGQEAASPQPASGGKPALATVDQLGEADRAVEKASQKALADLRSSKGSFLARIGLIRLRPLPASAVPILASSLNDQEKDVRGSAATILAYHHREVQKVLLSIEAARKREKDAQVQGMMDCAIEHLKAVGEELPVLADSAEVSKLLDAGITALTKTEKRALIHMRGTDYQYSPDGSRTEFTTDYYRPLTMDLPDRAAIGAPGTKCMAIIGWHWQVAVEDNASQVRAPDIGSIVRLEGPLKLTHSTLENGTILQSSSQGWSLLSNVQAVGRMKSFLQVRHQLLEGDLDYRGVGALGAGVIGPKAGELFQPLAEAAKSAPSGYSGQAIIAHCSLAFREIGDRKAVPFLKELRKRLEQEKARPDAVDAAIAALEKLEK